MAGRREFWDEAIWGCGDRAIFQKSSPIGIDRVSGIRLEQSEFILTSHCVSSPSQFPMALRFSQDIEDLLNRLATQPLTLGEIISQTAERGFSLVMALLVLPFLFPLPPGLTGFSGSACILLSLQMMAGRKTPWLPQRLLHMKFPPALSQALLKNIHRLTALLEKITRPRLRQIATHPLIWRVNGLVITWLAILLIAPIPFTNPIPTVGILLLLVAMLEADGLLMCVAYGMTVVITGVCGGMAYLAWRGITSLGGS